MLPEVCFQPTPPNTVMGLYHVDELTKPNAKPYTFVDSDRLIGGCEGFKQRRYKNFTTALLDYDTKREVVWIFDPIN